MLNMGLLVFCDTSSIRSWEFGSYIWDEKAAQQGEDRPVKKKMTTDGPVRYFMCIQF